MRVAVLMGGTSPERDVSLRSGTSVAQGLERAGYDVVQLDVRSITHLLDKWGDLEADVAFIALHGGWGEDGRIQAALAARGIPFTGSGAASCRVSMDKSVSLELIRHACIPVPPGFVLFPGDEHRLQDAIRAWRKIVIKPASGGSTVAVTMTEDCDAALDGLLAVWDNDTKAIVEKYIAGREITCAVFEDGGSTIALPAIEIRPRSGFYDYGSKYTAGATEYICPAPLPQEVASRIADAAVRTHRVHGCSTYSRVDLRVTEDCELFTLEVNTAPGMTDTSLVPKAAAAHGWSFEQMLSKIVEDAAVRR